MGTTLSLVMVVQLCFRVLSRVEKWKQCVPMGVRNPILRRLVSLGKEFPVVGRYPLLLASMLMEQLPMWLPSLLLRCGRQATLENLCLPFRLMISIRGRPAMAPPHLER